MTIMNLEEFFRGRVKVMKRVFFNLENLFLAGLFLVLLVYSALMVSCTPATSSSNLSSQSDDDDSDDRDSSRKVRYCEDRDSCQESCDLMFLSASARRQCYELNFDDVGGLEEVFDTLSSNTIHLSDLEDMDIDDFKSFVQLDADGWVDLIEESDTKDEDKYDIGNARTALQWIAENDDVAEAIMDEDEHSDILRELFIVLGADSSNSLSSTITVEDGSTNKTTISWSFPNNQITFADSDNTPGTYTLQLTGRSAENEDFFSGFIKDNTFKNKLFIDYAESEGNTEAVELAHKALKNMCDKATGDEFPDEEVQQCMLGVYCSMNDDGIFDDVLDSIGENVEFDDDCPKLTDPSDLEDIFNN